MTVQLFLTKFLHSVSNQLASLATHRITPSPKQVFLYKK